MLFLHISVVDRPALREPEVPPAAGRVPEGVPAVLRGVVRPPVHRAGHVHVVLRVRVVLQDILRI